MILAFGVCRAYANKTKNQLLVYGVAFKLLGEDSIGGKWSHPLSFGRIWRSPPYSLRASKKSACHFVRPLVRIIIFV